MQPSSTPKVPVPPSVPAPSSRLRRWWRGFENVLFVLALLLAILYFVLQLPTVQNWLMAKITAQLEEDLQTKVRIRHLNLAFFDNVVLEGLYIEDQRGDTLLYAESFSAGLNSNVLSLLSGGPWEFNEVSLQRARFHLRRYEGQRMDNLQFLIDYFTGEKKPKTDRKPSRFRLRVQNIYLTDVVFLQESQVRGYQRRFSVPRGTLRVNRFDVANNTLDLPVVSLQGLAVEVAEFTPKPLPPVARPVPTTDTTTVKQPRPPLRINIGRLGLGGGRFVLDRYQVSAQRAEPYEAMDFNHLRVESIDIEARNVYFDDNLLFKGYLQHLSAREQSGFHLTHSEAREVLVCDTLAALYGMKIQTPTSSLGDTLVFRYDTYRDFNKFNRNVKLDVRLAADTKVRLGDIPYFSAGLLRNTFFTKNRDRIVALSGRLSNVPNKLSGNGLHIGLGGNITIAGGFTSDHLTEGPDALVLGFTFEELKTDLVTLRELIPGFNAPAFFNRLGNIRYVGKYDIVFGYDHILDGQIKTDIGSGDLDMKLALPPTPADKAEYSGALSMRAFDLGAWTGNKDLGKTSFQINIEPGSTGLTLPTIDAKVRGTIDTLAFRGYHYRDLRMDGAFSQSIFTGKVGVADDNIDFSFNGTMNFRDSVPLYAFSADLRRLDMRALHLVDEDWVLSGEATRIDLRFRSVSDLRGFALLRNVRLVQDAGEYVHQIDSMRFTSDFQTDGSRFIHLESELLEAELGGRFGPAVLHNLGKMLCREHPSLGAKLGLPAPDSLPITDFIDFYLQVRDSRNLTKLFAEKLDTLRDVAIRGRFDGVGRYSELRVDLPQGLRFNNVFCDSIRLRWESDRDSVGYDLLIPRTQLANGQQLAEIRLTGDVRRDRLWFDLKTDDDRSIVESLNLKGALSARDSLWELRFSSSDIQLFGERWVIDDNNFVRIGRNYLETENMELFNGDRRISLYSQNNGRGLSLMLAQFDLSFLNKIFAPKGLDYRGRIFSFDLAVQDLANLKTISATIETDTIFANGLALGRLDGYAEWPDLKAPVVWLAHLRDEQQLVRIGGGFNPANGREQTVGEVGIVRPGGFSTNLKADNYQFAVLKAFVPGISNLAGRFDGIVKLGGPPGQIGMEGSVLLKTAQFQIDYLKTTYFMRNQRLQLSNYLIWATGGPATNDTRPDTIYDSQRNAALVRGGLRHNFFKDWRIECEIESLNNNFLILNTTRQDNSLYYGRAQGKFNAKFTGTFVRTNIAIIATTGKDTRLNIPVSTASEAGEVRFINFKKPQTGPVKTTPLTAVTELKGLNFELNLSITPDAEVQLIFDEQAGDIVKGQGEGDILLNINRAGEFKMYGSYTIRRGEYLFTLLNFINKPFTVRSGGTINWYGDPFGAQINLAATYEESTSLYNLLQSELEVTQSTDLIAEAKRPGRTVVTMYLDGSLLKPNLRFDLSFPNISSRLKSLADSKLRQLTQDQGELSRQVFGLIVVGSFLPGNSAFIQNSDYLSSGINTITQMLSNQLSSYLSGLASEWFGRSVSSIDFDIAYNEYRNELSNNPSASTQTGRELQLRLSSGLFNDRVTIQFGSNFGLGSTPGLNTGNGFLGNDFVIEIQLTQDRRWRLKAYQRSEPDIGASGIRNRFGAGFSFRQEYDSFLSLVNGVSGWMKRK
jgi:TamB, inner membrane protein subunit of TAM complex